MILPVAALAVGGLFTLAAAEHGAVQRIKVHGRALEGNLDGDSPDRDVSIYLPPSYKTSSRRYPVLYMLHGFTDDDAKWFGFVPHWINLPKILDQALAAGESKEMIVVMPNAYTRFAGSFYGTSATTGDWDTYIAHELVAYMDEHYRTLPNVNGRGLAGHSMGGYGAIRIGMRHPEVFSSVYLLSPCCMSADFGTHSDPEQMRHLEAMKTVQEIDKAGFMARAVYALAAAWSPDPKNPPFFLDLPFRDAQPRRDIAAKWAANAPLAMVDQYVPNLRRLHAIAFDAGNEDRQIAATNKELDALLAAYGIAHTYETYEGNHINHIADRIETRVLPFFTRNLQFAK